MEERIFAPAIESYKPMSGNAKAARSSTPKRRVSAEEVAQQVMRLLEARVLLPGDRLREQDLADRFKVSRGPVREALRILEARSVVHIEPMKGATITRLSDDEALDAVASSASLFGVACRLACSRRTDADLAKIDDKIAKLEAMLNDGYSPREFFLQTLRIGRAVGQAARSPRLMRMVEDIRFGAPDYFGPLGFTSDNLRQEALLCWKAMRTALAERDAASAEALGRKVHDDALAAALVVVA
ncbi:MAG: GntR family transcriptional regulator [Erythrobacteraceae bacterium]|jgi:DNA-binding GntR family transcriptional regulator